MGNSNVNQNQSVSAKQESSEPGIKKKNKKGKKAISLSPEETLNLTAEIKTLRESAKTACEVHARDMYARLTSVIDSLERSDAKPISAKKGKKMRDIVESLKLKPDKGRQKDLNRIEEVLGRLERKKNA